MSIRVLIADDHPIRPGWVAPQSRSERPGLEVVGEAADGVEVLELAKLSRGCFSSSISRCPAQRLRHGSRVDQERRTAGSSS